MSQYLETVEAEERRAAESASGAPAGGSESGVASSTNRRDQRRRRARERELRDRLIKPLQREMEQVEADIAVRDERKAAISAELEKPENMSDNQKLMELTLEYQNLERESESLFTRWEELSVEIERAEASLVSETEEES